jgi:hypothetical protein
MATQLRNCVVRCGASGFAVDYWGHKDFIGARGDDERLRGSSR